MWQTTPIGSDRLVVADRGPTATAGAAPGGSSILLTDPPGLRALSLEVLRAARDLRERFRAARFPGSPPFNHSTQRLSGVCPTWPLSFRIFPPVMRCSRPARVAVIALFSSQDRTRPLGWIDDPNSHVFARPGRRDTMSRPWCACNRATQRPSIRGSKYLENVALARSCGLPLLRTKNTQRLGGFPFVLGRGWSGLSQPPTRRIGVLLKVGTLPARRGSKIRPARAPRGHSRPNAGVFLDSPPTGPNFYYWLLP